MIATSKPNRTSKTVVVIGNGMVGHRFIERLVGFDEAKRYSVVTFCEEPRAAYNRVNLTKFFEYRAAEPLMIANVDWYREHDVALFIGDRASEIDRGRRVVRSQEGREIRYDRVVLATGSSSLVPPITGVDKKGVFVYRTIEDLESILEYAKQARSAAVIGGGLLGLEAAKAAVDLGLETHVVEAGPRLMPRQIDDAGSRLLVAKIEELGVRVHLGKPPKEILGAEKVEGLAFPDEQKLDVDMVIVAAGIRPRDELARACGLRVGERGGVIVDDLLRTSDPFIFAIGEVALHRNMIHGLVAPGYEMADIVANHLTGTSRYFCRTTTATKLKLMGVDVASFGHFVSPAEGGKSVVFEDPLRGVYQKLLVTHDGMRILEGIFVGDTSNYDRLAGLFHGDKPLSVQPGSLLFGEREAASDSIEEMPDEVQICSCNNVTKGAICHAIHAKKLYDIFSVKTATNAATCCGGCLPVVQKILHEELEKAGHKVDKSVCEHFPYTRQQLFQIIKIKQIRSFGELIAGHGKGHGCETCRPAVASIFASLWNDNILDHAELQDTNDRFLANIQKGGSYSVIPRIPAGEITPENLIAIGAIAKKYGLYTKITGGQRIDMLGAPAHRLPDIWEELVDAGFESGHAYGKAMRTIKSCVGTTWCRFAVGDSVGFAVRLELRDRGIRAPHKLKAAVSGCVRECAEAQSKDFGLIATESLSPETDYPVNLGMACPKGWEALRVLQSDDRATAPMLRENGKLRPVDWDMALRTFCSRIKAIQEKHGPHTVAFLSTGQIATEEMAFLGALAKFGMGLRHGDGNTRQCMATAVTAYKQSFGFDAPPYSYEDLEESDVIVLVGANLCIAHPILWERVCRNRHKPQIVVVDPRKTETAMAATLHLPIKPKSDLAFFYGLAAILIREGWIDRRYIADHTDGFAAFAEHVAEFTPERVAELSGIDVATLHWTARLIHEGQRVSFWWTMGVNQSYEGTRTAQSLINLALITGNMGRPGTGANSITGQCNAMGSRLFSNTTNLLGGHDFENAADRRKIADILAIDVERIPAENSWAYHEIVEGILKEQIKSLWVIGTNPAHSWINRNMLDDVLGRLDFLVVEDMYESTETARFADLLLPAAGWGEKDGTFINSERRIGRIKKVAKAPGLALADFSIFRLIAHYWGCGEMFAAWSDPAAVFRIMKELSGGQPCDITGIVDYDMLDACGGIQWPYVTGSPPPEQHRRLFDDGRYYHADGRARLLFESPRRMPERPSERYPYLLLTGRATAAQWHTQTRTAKSAVLRQLAPQQVYVEVNPEDAERENLRPNQRVLVESQRGSVKARVFITHSVQPGQVFMPMHYAETNQLTHAHFDPYSKQPSYKDCAVRIRNVSEKGGDI